MIKRKQAENNMGTRHVCKKAATGKTAKEKNALRKNAKEKNALRKNAIGRNTLGRTGGRKLYVLGAAGLVLLLLFSFFVPQLIFRLRDSYLCRDFVYEKQEDMDVALLGAAYEPSLGQRLRSFVEGQEKGRNFYVSVQEMEVTQELYQQLRGTTGILYQQDILAVMLDTGMVSYTFVSQDTFTINCWKRYVIYSDEYTEGINFIIWYLDLQADDGRRLELLIDAEDATLYALYAERSISLTKAVKLEITDVMRGVSLDELWYFLNYYYQSISREELENYIDMRSYNGQEANDGQKDTDMDAAQDETVTLEMLESALANGEAMSLPDTNTIILHLLFSRQNLDLSFRIFQDENENNAPSQHLALYMGIDSISELIPEFAERF